MSQIISVTRIWNEDDIVESFVRHNCNYVDHMLLLDDGSTDRTLSILRSLKNEGLPLTVFGSQSVTFDELAKNTWVYQAASQLFGADWIIFVDADEFIETKKSCSIRDLLPSAGRAITVELKNYGQTSVDDLTEVIFPKRLRWHRALSTNVYKLILRGGLSDIIIGAGNHCAFEQGNQIPAPAIDTIMLAHYPRRNGWQIIQKIVAGWLKVTASGRHVIDQGYSSHYKSPFETLRDRPEEILFSEQFFVEELCLSDAIESPLDYLGGALRYYRYTDPASKATHIFINFLEALASQHGNLIDEFPDAKRLVEQRNNKRNFLF